MKTLSNGAVLSAICLGLVVIGGCHKPEIAAPQPKVAKSISAQKLSPTRIPPVAKPTSKRRKQRLSLPKRLPEMVVIDIPHPQPEATLNPITIAIQQADKDRVIEEKKALIEADRLQAEVKVPPPWEVVSSIGFDGDCMTNQIMLGKVRNTDLQMSHSLNITWGIYESSGAKVGSISAKSPSVASGETWIYKAYFLNPGNVHTAKFESANSLS